MSGINAPSTRCAGEQILFAVDPTVSGATYSWFFNGPATPSTSTAPSVLVSWSSQGVYLASLTVTRGACTESYDMPINITQEIFAAAGEDKEICEGQSVQIGGSPTGPSGANYLWTPNLFINNNMVANPVVTPPVTTTYTVQVTQNGCTTTESVTVVVNTELNPHPDAGPDVDVCLGETVTIGGQPDPNAFFMQWSTSTGDIPGANASFLDVSPVSNTWYFITAYNQLGCIGVDSVLVTVNPTPSVNIGPDQTICNGNEATFTATINGGTAPFNYLWSTGATTASITVSPTSTTTYSVTVTDANGCTASDDAQLTVNPNPIANAGPDQENCGVEEATLTATATGGTAPYTFEWNQGLGVGASQTVMPEVTTTYIVLVTDANGCTDTDEVTIIVLPLPNPPVPTAETVCTEDDIELMANVTAAAYNWTGPNGFASSIQNPVIQDADTSYAGIYTLEITDANGCKNAGSVEVIVGLYPTITVTNSSECAQDLLTYSAEFMFDFGIPSVNAGDTVRLGSNEYRVDNIPVGTNLVFTVTSDLNCASNRMVTSPNCECPEIGFPIAVEEVQACAGKPFPTIVVRVGPNSTADWFDVETGGTPIALGTISYQPTAAGTYYVVERDLTNNCTTEQRLPIEVTVVECDDCGTPDCLDINIERR